MSPEVVECIQNCKEDIQENEFTHVYKNIDAENTAELTEVFLRAGINPLEYMKRIPKNYLYACLHSIAGFNIPDNIISIGHHAFAVTDLVNIEIPEGVEVIEKRAFSSCTELVEAHLPSTLIELGRSVFSKCIRLNKIFYNGTFEEFENIIKPDNWLSATQAIEVTLVCKDGEFSVR